MFDPLHLLFDLAAYGFGLALMIAFRRLGASVSPSPVPDRLQHWYLLVLTNGVIVGSIALGTWNVMAAQMGPALGKSILGAIVGGIVAVEIFKLANGLRGSTAAALVPGLAFGIFLGRWGCFFAGLDDFTYGVPAGDWPGVDFGDGVPRHPVQLYEAFVMLLFGALAAHSLGRRHASWWRHGFYYFAIVYGAQRFAWEFLKPYPVVALGMNVFQWLSLALVAYGATMIYTTRTRVDAGQLA